MIYSQTEAPSNSWMQTRSGIKFDLLNPHPSTVEISDIAYALSHQCRYAGHSKEFYSVAEHSVRCADIARSHRFEVLMHDAAEAYCQDMIRPMKMTKCGELYREIEDKVMGAIAERFGIEFPFTPEAKKEITYADNTILFTEKRDIVNHCGVPWTGEEEYTALPERIVPWSPETARAQFRSRFYELYKG